MTTGTLPAKPADPPRDLFANGDLAHFAESYLESRGMRPDDGSVLLVRRVAGKYRGPMPIARRELERFVDRVLRPSGAGPF